MGPKKDKDLINENFWRTSIENGILNDETWKVKVVLMEAAGSEQDRIYLNKFEVFSTEEKRFVIKNICRTETIFMVNQLGGEKKVKDDNLRVFEEGQLYLKDKKDIPPDVLALIIKHQILKMKQDYLFIKQQRLVVKEGMRRESATMVNQVEVRGTVRVKSPEPEPPPPPSKGKGKKKEPDVISQIIEPDEGKKYNTALRVRGEEWRDKVYVDDFPTDGPDVYVAITGFVEPLLAISLINIGVPLSAIIQIRVDAQAVKIPSTLFRATKRGQSQTEILTEKSLKFWEDLQISRIQKEYADAFKDTAFIIFTPPYWNTTELTGEPDKIYDELCYLMYDVQDLTRQHIHYLDNMHIIKIPEDSLQDPLIKFYYKQIVGLPLECVTTYLVLDSILQSICNGEDLLDESAVSSNSTAVTLNKAECQNDRSEVAESIVIKLFNTLCKTDLEKKSYRATYGEEYENHKDPIIINHGDHAKYSTFHLGNINLDNIVWSTLIGMPINKLWLNQEIPSPEVEAKINFHVNVLLSCFDRDDVETAELNRLIQILACRKLFNNRSSLKKLNLPCSSITTFKKVYLKRSILAEPLSRCSFQDFGSRSPSFPSITKSENSSKSSCNDDIETQRIKFLFDCPDLSELVSAAEIANGKPIGHLIDNFEYFEDFSGITSFQSMHDAFNKFNCIDYKYCEVTDCLILMFHNSHDKDGITREEWRCHLATPVCLQDFFDFVLEENYSWIQNEEKIYDENMIMKSKSLSKSVIDPFALKSCVEDTDVEVDLMMEGSLKHQDVIKIEKEDSEENDVPQLDNFSSSTPSEPKTKSSKKSRSPASATPKHLGQSYMAAVVPSESSVITMLKKPFSGYDLGDRRVEVFGKDGTYFSKDGTKVYTKYTLLIPTNLEYIILNITSGNFNNEFWMHRALGDSVPQDIRDTCESFRITTADQVMIYMKKQCYQVTIDPDQAIENVKQKDTPLKSSFVKPSTTTMEPLETRYFHSVYVTWPNGLITESIYEANSPVISHIKQYYLVPLAHLDEEMRCISLNGEVIIFRPSGVIEVLKPDSSFIKITKYEKTLVKSPVNENFSEISSEKEKKGKSKQYKDKPRSRTSSKSSKTFSDDEKLFDINPEYELKIHEYEVIESNGLRQKWVDLNSIDIEKLVTKTATDYCLGEVFSKRMDGTTILLNRDCIQIVTFPNETRIITEVVIEEEEVFPEWTEEERDLLDIVDSDTIYISTTQSKASVSQKGHVGSFSNSVMGSTSRKMEMEEEEQEEKKRTDGYVSIKLVYTIEHANFTTVSVNKDNQLITIDSPNQVSIKVNEFNRYNMNLDPVTTTKFNGESLEIFYEACSECMSRTMCNVKIMNNINDEVGISTHWLKLKDSLGKMIVVNGEGNILVSNERTSEEEMQSQELHGEKFIGDKKYKTDENIASRKSESSVTSHGKCTDIFTANTIRFFVLRRELSCSELIHKVLLEQYQSACRWQPWCSITQHDTFGDNRSLVSIMTPINVTESEKWLMESKFAEKPTQLVFKDLKEDCGKGFYHWMRPYKRFEPSPRKPPNVLPPRLPRAFIQRTLEKQWKDEVSENLKGAKELLRAILKYRDIMESETVNMLNIPIIDIRPMDERLTDDIIQALGHRIYEDLKYRLDEDLKTRMTPDITTKTREIPDELSVEGELEEETDEYQNRVKRLEDERAGIVKEVEDAAQTSPNLKRYWLRREEEFKEEQFHKYLLREGSVPPYFRNILGGAIWWEMNNTAGDAVTKSERNKMKCVCSYEGSSKEHDPP